MSKNCERFYCSPLDAMTNGNREKIMYVTCVQPEQGKSDFLATVDIDPESSTYCQILHKSFTGQANDELHHSGWNVCGSCQNVCKRNKLILPALLSGNIYIFDMENDPKKPELFKTIPFESYGQQLNLSTPHTTHCLPTGDILISMMGDFQGNHKGNFLVVDGKTFEVKSRWTSEEHEAKFGYDFWYQPYHNVLVSSEWGAPKYFKKGFNVNDPIEESGKSLNVFDWSSHDLIQVIDLGHDGYVPLEIRFLHDPKASEGFVGVATAGNVFRFYKDATANDKWKADKVIDIKPIAVKNWISGSLSAMITDILISLDDRFLYVSNWWHGDVRQYDIRNTREPRLVGQVFVGGKLQTDTDLQILDRDFQLHEPIVIRNRRLHGGPQMLQLSLDGKRLYVTNSLFSPWDRQFYPETLTEGSFMIRIDVDCDNGGLVINRDFLVDFGCDDGPVLAHEMRYPGGDCTSDIWLAK